MKKLLVNFFVGMIIFNIGLMMFYFVVFNFLTLLKILSIVFVIGFIVMSLQQLPIYIREKTEDSPERRTRHLTQRSIH